MRRRQTGAPRHSGSQRIKCRVDGDEEQFWFKVRDWSKGFNEEDLARVNGDANLRKRADILGGKPFMNPKLRQRIATFFNASW